MGGGDVLFIEVDLVFCYAGFCLEDHAGGEVVGIDGGGGVYIEELSEEAAIAVAEKEDALLGLEVGEEVSAGALEGGAEAQVFEELVVGSDAVAIHSARSGVRRMRSARMRRASGER